MIPPPADGAGTLPWRDLLAEAQGRLAGAGVARPDQESRWIVEEASGFEGPDLGVALDAPATIRGVAAFDRLLARRLAGEPLQYVLGHWSFRSLELMVDRRVLIPRPETEQVVTVALAEIDRLAAGRPGTPVVVADLGTGSGAIGLSIAAERTATRVWATDLSPGALAVAAANLAGLGPGATRVRLCEGSWFEALPPEMAGTLDLVVSNPPYVAPTDELGPEVAGWEPLDALIPGPTGLEALLVLVDQAPRWLARPGVLVLELAPGQARRMAEVARRSGFAQVRVEPDLTGRERTLVARIGDGGRDVAPATALTP